MKSGLKERNENDTRKILIVLIMQERVRFFRIKFCKIIQMLNNGMQRATTIIITIIIIIKFD